MATTGADGKKYPFLGNYWLSRHEDSVAGNIGYIAECPYSLPDYILEAIERRRANRLAGLTKRNKFW